MSKTVIIGFGNYLMGDDGVGIHAIKILDAISLPQEVVIIDGGVNTFAALSYLQDATKVFFIDALVGGGQAGTLYRLIPDDLQSEGIQALSVHDFSLEAALLAERHLNELPPIIIFGIEPARIELSADLSPEVSTTLNRLIDILLKEIA